MEIRLEIKRIMITNRNIRYFNIAKQISQLSDFDRHHIGCVIVYKSYVLSIGFNTNKTHPIQMEYNKYRNFNNPNNVRHKLHAEIMALWKIRNLNIDFSKIEVYTYRENKNGNKALAAPCQACRKYIKDMGIKNVYYTGDGSYCFERMG
jgi:deoxycytidylate deaminase